MGRELCVTYNKIGKTTLISVLLGQGRQAGFRGRGRGAESENPGRGSGSSGFADPKPRPGSGVVGVRLIQNPDPGGVGDFPGFKFFLKFFFFARARALSTVLSTLYL